MNMRHTHANAWAVRSFRAPRLLLGALCLMMVACDDSGYAIIQSHLITTEPGSGSGYSCTQLSASGSAGTGRVDDGFWITETQDTEGVTVEWGQDETKLGRRDFPTEFFEAGKMERFVIDSPNGDRFSYMVWGAKSCTQCPEQSYTPLPGDDSGCESVEGELSSSSDAPNDTTEPSGVLGKQ